MDARGREPMNFNHHINRKLFVGPFSFILSFVSMCLLQRAPVSASVVSEREAQDVCGGNGPEMKG